MKLKIIFLTIMIALIVFNVSGANIKKSKVKFDIVHEKILIGYDRIYEKVPYNVYKCNYLYDSKVDHNVTTCGIETLYNDTLIEKIPKYKNGNIISITKDSKEYKSNKYNTVVCEGERGTYLLEVSRKDGGELLQQVRKDKLCSPDGYPIIHTGWDCYRITDLETNIKKGEKKFNYCDDE